MKNSGTKGLVIDLDETLSWIVYYMAGELAKLYGNPQNLSVEELCERMMARNVNFWNVEEIRKWGLLALESKEMAEQYPIIEGADKVVEKIDHVIKYCVIRILRHNLRSYATLRCGRR